MKFAVEVHIDNLDSYEDLDGTFMLAVQQSIQKQIMEDFNKEAGQKIAKAADRLITAKTELLINTLLEKPVVISDGWQSTRNYDSIYDMVEEQMTALYSKKFEKAKGTCDIDPILGKIQAYVDTQVSAELTKIERIIKQHADRVAKKTLEESSLITALKGIIKV